MPSADGLAAANAIEAARPDPEEPSAVPAIPVPAQTGEFNENLFFDAEALVPESEIAKKSAPSKVDPVLNPGSVLVVSTKTASSGSKEAQLVAAERARKLGRHESALQIYEKLYQKNKRDPNILMGRATTLQSLGRVDEAIRAYEEFLNVKPKDVNAQVNLQGLVGKHYPAVALRSLRDLYENNPSNVGVMAQIAVIEAKLGNYDEAVRYLGMAASMEPENASHLFNLAVIADKAGDKKAAIRYYEESLEADTLYGAGRSIPRESVFERLAQLR
jgi:tetratricopeptide (TPR) repeat protein